MSKRESSFFEQNIEKAVLAIVAAVCIVLAYFFVIRSPVTVSYDGQKISPGEIDKYILDKETEALEARLNREPEPGQPYKSRVDDLMAIFNSAISNIDVSYYPPQPIVSTPGGITDNRAYRIPQIGEVEEVLAGYFRAVVYVPVNDSVVYTQENSEPNDIDLVTVEAKIDVSGLYKRFSECFTGESVPLDWRDPCLAVPVFAAVQLQRQKLLDDGTWSDWQTVPRSRIDSRKGMFEIIENINDLPAGGVKVRLLQFNDAQVRKDLLQPGAYQVASANQEWFPPSLHRKYEDFQKEVIVAERREATAEKKEEREGDRLDRRRQATVKSRQTEVTGGIDTKMPSILGAEGMPTARKTPTKKSQPDRDSEKERTQKGKEILKTTDDFYKEFEEILISEDKNLVGLDKKLLFWGYDDTVEPGNSYQYRVRLGVFNPLAGTHQFGEQEKLLKDKVILWSGFSKVTERMDIPGKSYLFPREIQEATMSVTVQVSRYVLGYWYSKDFTVKQGELVGKVDEYKKTEEETSNNVTVPQTVDYTTGAVVVDIVPVNDWSGGNNLRVRHFYDMLCSFDGRNIERMPVKSKYWTEALQSKFNEIKKYERESKEPLRGWTARRTEHRIRSTVTSGGEGKSSIPLRGE